MIYSHYCPWATVNGQLFLFNQNHKQDNLCDTWHGGLKLRVLSGQVSTLVPWIFNLKSLNYWDLNYHTCGWISGGYCWPLEYVTKTSCWFFRNVPPLILCWPRTMLCAQSDLHLPLFSFPVQVPCCCHGNDSRKAIYAPRQLIGFSLLAGIVMHVSSVSASGSGLNMSDNGSLNGSPDGGSMANSQIVELRRIPIADTHL